MSVTLNIEDYALGFFKVFKNKRCGNRIKAGFFNVIIRDMAIHGTND